MPSINNSIAENRTLRSQRALELKIEWTTVGHISTRVLLMGLGPFAERIMTAKHLVDTFNLMRMAIQGKEGPVGEGFYEGYISIIWVYIGAVMLGLLVLITGVMVVFHKI